MSSTNPSRKRISWYRYKLTDKLTGKISYWGNALDMNHSLGFKSTSPIQDMFRNNCKRQTLKTQSRWSRYEVKRVFILRKDGNKYTIKRKLKALLAKVHAEIRSLNR